MVLRELIDFLERYDPATPVPLGFHFPHSYRGSYEELAFEPKANTTVGEMLDAARSAVGKVYGGYKGGDYRMGDYTRVNLAEYGRTGEEIGEHLLRYMVGDIRR